MTALLSMVLLVSLAAADTRKAEKLLSLNDVAGAERAVTTALAQDREYSPAVTLLARIQMIEGRLSAARALLEQALRDKPAEKPLRFLLGFCFYLDNDFENARAALMLADQNDSQVLLYRALTEEGLNHPDEALQWYQRALATGQHLVETRVALARLLRNQGQTTRAESLIDEALRSNPADRGALYEKAQCLLARSEWKAAAESGERALLARGEAPLEREIRYLLVRAYLKAGETGRAAEHRALFEKLPLSLVR